MADLPKEPFPPAVFTPNNLRTALAGDRDRPLYHFLAPANWMNDPNGAILWNGKYHLFYQYNPNGPFWGSIHWGHAASSDLLHWEDFPIALAPSPDGPDQHGCWSGCVVDDRGIPTALYTAPGPQTVCLATGDQDLRNWKKEETPVISEPPSELELTGFPSITGDLSADFRDPFVWPEAGRWYLLMGSGFREKGGTVLLYESDDLHHWRYLRPFFSAMVGPDCNMFECPILLRASDRCALFVCPHPEAKYVTWFAGDRDNGVLREHRRGQLDYGIYAYAANVLRDPIHERSLLWTWIKEGRPGKVRRAAGWAGLLSLPKECSLDTDYSLLLKPAAELVALRTEGRTIEGQRLNSFSGNPLVGFAGDCLEIEVEISFDEPVICQLSLRSSPDGQECTTIVYHSADKSLVVDGSKSSLDPDVHNLTFSGPLAADQNGLVRFHAFLDRSILEVFLGDSACITQRLYPTREDSLGVSFSVKSGTLLLRRLAAWKMASVW